MFDALKTCARAAQNACKISRNRPQRAATAAYSEVPASRPPPTGSRRPQHTPRETGFTLVEILVVLVIIGIMTAMAVVRFSGAGSGRSIRQTVSNWQALMPALQARSVLQPALLGLRLEKDGYRIYQLDADLAQHQLTWVPLKTGRLAGKHHFPRGIHITMAANQQLPLLGDFLKHGNSAAQLTQTKHDLSTLNSAKDASKSSGHSSTGPAGDDDSSSALFGGDNGQASPPNNASDTPQSNATDADKAQQQDTDSKENGSDNDADADSDSSDNDNNDSNGDKIAVDESIKPQIIFLPNGDISATQLLIHGAHGIKPVRLYITAGGNAYTKDSAGNIQLPDNQQSSNTPNKPTTP